MPRHARPTSAPSAGAEPESAPYVACLNLTHRLCVVVGGGPVAARKVTVLRASGAQLRVVSPRLTPQLRLLAHSGQLEWRARPYAPDDLAGALLVFAATDSPDVNRQVALDAQAAGALVTVADAPELGDFSVPATLRRGELVVAVSTGGGAPGYARRLRELLEAMLGPEYGDALSLYAQARPAILAAPKPRQAELWNQLFALDLATVIRLGGSAAGQRALTAWRASEGLAE